MKRRLLPLFGILTIAWLLVFAGSVIVFRFIVPLEIPSFSRFATAVVQAVLATILVFLWLFIMMKLRDVYASRVLGPK